MTGSIPTAIAPGATIGILGGGQLGRMIALAAAPLGYRCHVFCPEEDSPAQQVSAAATVAAYDDEAALAAFAAGVDVVTYEFENIPAATVDFLAGRVPVRPGAAVLRIAQNRLAEKTFFNDRGIATAPFARVTGPAELEAAMARFGTPGILKTITEGYDGKGQVRLASPSESAEAWRRLGRAEGILEGFVDFVAECSVIVARGLDGAMAVFAPGENNHANGILDVTRVPARLPADILEKAEAIGREVATGLELVGLVCIELFVTRDGRVLANEMAPRPHNSGHWTIDACLTSQFEQVVRAICGLPLGSVRRLADAEMKNLIGDDIAQWRQALAEPDARLHLYGKAQPRPGRKMGHITYLRPLSERA